WANFQRSHQCPDGWPQIRTLVGKMRGMTLFVDLRANVVGGPCASEATTWDGEHLLNLDDFDRRVQGRDLVFFAHGYGVDRNDALSVSSTLESSCRMPSTFTFIGILWPGDSQYFGYRSPFEFSDAQLSGRVLARFLDDHATEAASLSFVAHSLG